MSKETYNQALSAVLREEGGKVDDPRDPGGRTNQGIIQRVYDTYRQRKGLAKRDVYVMDDAERDEIYRQSYWNLIKGDDLPPGIDLATLDGAVNSGVSRGVKWLQQALGVPADGVIGPATLHAAQTASEPEKVIIDMMDRRLAFVKSLKTWKTFGKGWSARIRRIEEQATAMARGSLVVATAPEPSTPSAKAAEADIKAPPSKAPGDVLTGAGVSAGGVGTVVNSVKDQLEPYAGASHWVSQVVIILIIAGAVLAIGGLAWRAWAMWKSSQMKAD